MNTKKINKLIIKIKKLSHKLEIPEPDFDRLKIIMESNDEKKLTEYFHNIIKMINEKET